MCSRLLNRSADFSGEITVDILHSKWTEKKRNSSVYSCVNFFGRHTKIFKNLCPGHLKTSMLYYLGALPDYINRIFGPISSTQNSGIHSPVIKTRMVIRFGKQRNIGRIFCVE